MALYEHSIASFWIILDYINTIILFDKHLVQVFEQ
jgi:hypothetical protein